MSLNTDLPTGLRNNILDGLFEVKSHEIRDVIELEDSRNLLEHIENFIYDWFKKLFDF